MSAVEANLLYLETFLIKTLGEGRAKGELEPCLHTFSAT